MEKFLNLCHNVTCDDVCLMEGFQCGLDKDLHFVMPCGERCWTLESYINFALWMNTSTFTVGETEDDSSLVQPHRTDIALPDTEPSPPSFRCAEHKPEPTADGEPIPTTINKPSWGE